MRSLSLSAGGRAGFGILADPCRIFAARVDLTMAGGGATAGRPSVPGLRGTPGSRPASDDQFFESGEGVMRSLVKFAKSTIMFGFLFLATLAPAWALDPLDPAF